MRFFKFNNNENYFYNPFKFFYIPFDASRWSDNEYISRKAQRFVVQKLGAPKFKKRLFLDTVYHSVATRENYTMI